jgi:hypothetical protein
VGGRGGSGGPREGDGCGARMGGCGAVENTNTQRRRMTLPVERTVPGYGTVATVSKSLRRVTAYNQYCCNTAVANRYYNYRYRAWYPAPGPGRARIHTYNTQ